MANGSDLFLLAALRDSVADKFDRPEPPLLLPPPFWSTTSSSSADDSDPDPFVPVFSSGAPFPDPGSDYSDGDDDAALSLDLFRRRRRPPPPSASGAAMDPFPEPLATTVFRVSEGPDEIGPPGCLGLSLGLGLDLGFEREEYDDAGDDADREVLVPGWAADDFFVGRRSSPSESIEFSRARPVVSGGLRVVELDSDSDSDGQIVAMGINSVDGEDRYRISDDVGLPICWDGLQLRDSQRDANEDFEWEEINAQVEERDVLSIMVVGNEETSGEIGGLDPDEAEHEDVVRNINWERILAMNNFARNPLEPEDVEAYLEDQEGLVYTSDYESYEVLFGLLAEQDSNIKGSPPAAKLVVEYLLSVVLTKEDAADVETICAVCKDGILAGERVKRLPCFHHYHEECILPWLRIRNTCPLCRFELPTDDPEYEKQKVRRAGSVVFGDEAQLRYGFEVLPEA